jgi:hypothetical protein
VITQVRARYIDTSIDQALQFSLVLMRFDGSAGQEIVASGGSKKHHRARFRPGHGVAPGV